MTERPQPDELNGRPPRPRRPSRPASPIISEVTWTGGLTPASAHVAVVVVYQRGEHEVLWPHDRHRVLLHRRPTTLYEVDLGLHQTMIPADLPSRDAACSFHASISVQWRVLDPSAIVRHRVSDIAETLSPHLLHRMRGITRNFEITQSALAEDEINTRLAGQNIDVTDPARFQQAMREATERDYLGAEYGLWTRIIAQLTPDDAAIEHHTKMTQLRWAIEEEKAEQELRLLQETHQQRITADRIAIYREIVAAGDIDRFALQLANNPGDIAAIDTIIREEQLASRRDTIDFVAHMVDSGVIERWEVNDQAREALQWLRDATARVIRDKEHRDEIESSQRQRRRGRGDVIEGHAEPPSGQPQSETAGHDSQAAAPDTQVS